MSLGKILLFSKSTCYKTIEVMTPKLYEGIPTYSEAQEYEPEEIQNYKYIVKKLGANYKLESSFYPSIKRKCPCPNKCFNTYLYIEAIYYNKEKNKRIILTKCTKCLNSYCFYQEIIKL